MTSFREISAPALTREEVALLDKEQIPKGFGTLLYNSLLTRSQKAAVPVGADADNPIVDSSGFGSLGTVSTTLYVRTYGASTGDGSLASPYSHPNQAISKIKSNGDAAEANPYLVDIGDGVYEGVFFNVPYTTLRGAGVGSTILRGTATALALYWGNATQASVDAFVLADGHAEASIDTDYADLIADATVTTLLGGKIANMTIESDDAANVAMAKIYVGDGFDTDLELRYIDNVYTPPSGGSVYIRNITGFTAQLFEVSDTLYVRNCRIGYCDFSKVQVLDAQHDSAAHKPAAPWNTTTVINAKGLHVGGTIALDGDGGTCSLSMFGGSCNGAVSLTNSGKITAENVHFDNNLSGDGSPTITLDSCHVDGNFSITSPSTVNVSLKGSHIQGDATIATGGSKTINMYGGAIQGTLTDADGSLTYTAPGTGGGSAAASSPVLPPIFHLPLDEGTGSTANDSGPLGYNGTISGGCSWVSGEASGSYALECPQGEGITLATGITEIRFDSARRWRLEIKFKCSSGSNTADLMTRIDGSYDVLGEKVFYLESDGRADIGAYLVSPLPLAGNTDLRTGAWFTLHITGGPGGYSSYVDAGDGATIDATKYASSIAADVTTAPIIFGNGYGGTKDTITIEYIKYFVD